MSTTTAFTPQVIGETEKALNAILDRLLAGTSLTEPQWVTLTVTAAGGGRAVAREELVGRLAGALKVSESDAQTRIGELVAARLLAYDGSSVKLTEAGQELHGRIRAATTETTVRLWGDLPAEDLATAGRVLDTVLARANAELAVA